MDEVKTNGKHLVDAKLQKEVVVVADPFWPEGAIPNHITPRQEELSADNFMALKHSFTCEKCGKEQQLGTYLSEPAYPGAKVCRACNEKNAQNSALAARINANWMETSKEIGREVFERQSDETDTEWHIWETYRSYYPMRLPTWAELATKSGSAVATVIKTAQKWSFKVRILEWARYTDADIQEKRIAHIREMNEKQLSLADRIMTKVTEAVESLQPALMKPSEITAMAKMVTDLQRTVNTYVEPTVKQNTVESASKQQQLTKVEDISEITEILSRVGLMGQNKTVAVEQTTRVLVTDNNNGGENDDNNC